MARHQGAIYTTIAILAASALAWGFWGFSFDDNFITYRYARNWTSGEGLVYNAGERVLGTSAPGYALLLGTLASATAPLGIGVPAWGTLLSAFSIAWLGWLALRGLRFHQPWLSSAFALLALTFPLNVYLLGSEMLPVSALVAEAAYQLLDRRRPLLAGLLVFGAVFLRLDAGLAAIVLGVSAWWQARRLPVTFALSGLAPMALWFGMLLAWFGRVIPLTLQGKKALYEVPYTLRQWQMLTQALPVGSAVLLLGGALLGLLLAARRGLLRNPVPIALGAWLLAHEAVYRGIGVWFAPWYHIPLSQALLLLFVAGVWLVAEAIGGRLSTPILRRWAPAALAAAFLAPVLLPGLTFVAGSWHEPPDDRLRVYRQAGVWIDRNLPPEAEILAIEIGVLGWESSRPVLDYGGLVSPSFTAAKLSGTRPALVAGLSPDYIVVTNTADDLRAVLSAMGSELRYEVLAAFRRPDFHRGEVLVLGRTDARGR